MHEERHLGKREGEIWRALGLMSGTSLDGIDVAIIETDGANFVDRGGYVTYPYSDAFRAQLRQGLEDALALKDRRERPARLRLLEHYLTELHAEAVEHFLADTMTDASSIDVIGFHGQTVLHRPAERLTVQLGDGALLASRLGIDVVYDMRARDVALGGQGAPLVPVYHRAMLARLDARPIAVLNLGGVGNVTWIGRDGMLLAFDTGPGNALIDDWVAKTAGVAFDDEGSIGRRGRVSEEAVRQYLLAPFFADLPPKSLDRNAFDLGLIEGLSAEDGAATLAAFTAQSAARAREHFSEAPELWVVCGGGRRNRLVMELLAERVDAAVVPAEAVGLDGDGIEAEAWAYLAVRSRLGLPLTFPGTTGVTAPEAGGVLARPDGTTEA